MSKTQNIIYDVLLVILAGAVITTAIFQSALFALAPLIVAIILWSLLRLGAKKRSQKTVITSAV